MSSPPPVLQPVPDSPALAPADTYAQRVTTWAQLVHPVIMANDQALRLWQTQVSLETAISSTAAQNSRASAEESVAAAGLAAAAAQRAAADALLAPPPVLTDADRLSRFFDMHVNASVSGLLAAEMAKKDLLAYKKLITPLPGAPQ